MKIFTSTETIVKEVGRTVKVNLTYMKHKV